MLVLALLALALGLFVQWPGWWNGIFGAAGVALLAAWALGYPKAEARRRTVEHRAGGERRQRAVQVQVQRRGIGDRRRQAARPA
jgi:uncharacterized protein (DUF58 family)